MEGQELYRAANAAQYKKKEKEKEALSVHDSYRFFTCTKCGKERIKDDIKKAYETGMVCPCGSNEYRPAYSVDLFTDLRYLWKHREEFWETIPGQWLVRFWRGLWKEQK